jgi:hypothetical protein
MKPSTIEGTELAVAVRVRMVLAVFGPQQTQRDALLAQFVVHP